MTAAQEKLQPADKVRKVVQLALSDAVEINLLITLIKEQNTGGVNNKLNGAGAGAIAGVVRNALIARLVTLTARAYADVRDGDLHLRVAKELLKNNTTRQVFGANNGAEKLKAFDAQWAKCRGDHRWLRIKELRDKYTAHLGEPTEIDEATYADLFEFGAATAKAMELLALATSVAVNPINTDNGLVTAPKAFWATWKQAMP